MELIINISSKEKDLYKKASELVNVACEALDNKGFNVEYVDHTIESEEKLEDDSEDVD